MDGEKGGRCQTKRKSADITTAFTPKIDKRFEKLEEYRWLTGFRKSGISACRWYGCGVLRDRSTQAQ